MYCLNCKKEIEGKYCPECGTKLIEKPTSAGGLNLKLGDANAVSGGVHLADSHAVHNEDKSVHNTSNVSNVTHNVTNVAAQKTELEILQDKTTIYLNECRRAYEDNVLEQAEVNALDECRMKLGLDQKTADAILDRVRKISERNARKTSLTPLAKTKLKILTANLKKNEVKALIDQIDSLEALVERFEHDELLRKYYLVLSALKPERCIELKESTKIDSYWKSYWSYIAYIKAGRIKEAEKILNSLDRFANYPDDNITILATAGALMKNKKAEAKEYLNTIVGDYTPALQYFIDSIYLLLDPNLAKEMGANDNTCAFYHVNFFGQKDPKAKAAEEACLMKEAESKAKAEAERKAKAEAERKVKENKPEKIKTFQIGNVLFKMILVEAGTFTMGATSEMEDAWSEEKPTHQVTLTNDYYIGQTEVTQALWKAVMGRNPSYFKGNNKPVERVSWNDCKTFISKLNSLTGLKFRLPTEAEWEFAARGGNNSNHYQYSGSNDLDDVAWYDDNSGDTTHDVATKQPNELGIYDMSGNVWEWCSDRYDDYSSSPQTNPTGPTSGSDRVYRGGSWRDFARRCRSSRRYSIAPGYRSDILGLRLVLSE